MTKNRLDLLQDDMKTKEYSEMTVQERVDAAIKQIAFPQDGGCGTSEIIEYFEHNGASISEQEARLIWVNFSDSYAAGWLHVDIDSLSNCWDFVMNKANGL